MSYSESTDREAFAERHHYGFAHGKIPGMFQEDPEAAVLEMAGLAESGLQWLWFQGVPPQWLDLEAPVGLALEVLRYAGSGLIVVLFTLPRPWFSPGAYRVAAVLSQPTVAGEVGACSVWTQEKRHTDGPEEAAILGRWREGVHLNFGPLRDVGRDGFLEEVLSRVAPAGPGGVPEVIHRVEV